VVAITGTDGKTTTTLMAAAMMSASGRKAAAVGNTETPWVEALDEAHDCFAVECSSFRLHFTRDFRAEAATWLNLAPDHLDWHRDIDSYRSAKARIWTAARAGDVAVAPVRDESIQKNARATSARVVTFGLETGDYRVENGALVGPHGRIVDVGQLSRALPHDLTNALAASALVLESGLGSVEGVAHALARYHHAPHRIQLVGEIDGVSYYDDSKATSPHAAQAALTSFDRIVLIAGGKNKGLDLASMASQPQRMRAVVAIGHSAELIEAAFAGVCRVQRAGSMQEAVESARRMAEPGDVVLLSPGCTSYDWYSNYGERGDDFAECVKNLTKEKQR
jgi:UDP-N-acetylmuramoylalanine--D-glutamate ligase